MRINQFKIGIILSYIIILLNVIIGIVVTPFMVNTLGQSQFGLYKLIGAFVGYMSVLDFGLGNATIRYIVKYRQENDKERESNFLAMTMIIYGVISACVVFIGALIYYNTSNIFANSFTETEIQQAKVMIAILIVNMVITLPGNAFTSVINAYEIFAVTRITTIFKLLLRVLLLVVLLKKGFGAISIVVLDTFINILTILISMYVCRFNIGVRIKLKKIDKKILYEVFGFSFFIFVKMITDQAIWRVPPIIIGIKLTTTAVAVFAVGTQISSLFMQFSTAVSHIFFPKLTKMVIAGETNEALTDFMIKVGRIQGIVILYIYTAFAVLGRQFVFLWVGEGYNDSWLTALIVMTGLILPLMENSGLSILQAMKKHKFYVVVYLLICAVNVIFTFLIIDYTGIVGASVLTMLGMTVGHGVVINWYFHRRIGLDIIRFFRELIRGIFPVAIACGALMYLLTIYFPVNTWVMFVVNGTIFTLVYFIGIWFFGSNQYERNLLIKPVNRIIKSTKKVAIYDDKGIS